MRIIWLSNISLLQFKKKSSGTWIHSMYKELSKRSDIKIVANFTLDSSISKVVEVDNGGFFEYKLPYSFLTKEGLPKNKLKEFLVSKIVSLTPDLIHVWGMELFWGLLVTYPELERFKFLLEIQGFKSICQEPQYFYGGISYCKLKKMRGLPEYIYPKLYILNIQQAFTKWSSYEGIILKNFKYINTQSDWVRTIVSLNCSQAKIFKTGIILRQEFIDAVPWYEKHLYNQDHFSFFTITAPYPYKGVHVTFKAFALVLRKYPTAKLRIAGVSIHDKSFKNSGYVLYLLRLIRDLGIEHSVTFLGNLNSVDLLAEMHNADVFINSSFVESYCLALAEAMVVGMPCIACYTSAIPELIDDKKTGLLYPMGDYYSCADKIISLVQNSKSALELGRNARAKLLVKSNAAAIVDNQVKTYNKILIDKD